MKNNKLLIFALLIVLYSCSSTKIFTGNTIDAKDAKYDLFYETFDGVIHPVNSGLKTKYFVPEYKNYLRFGDEKVEQKNVKAFQLGKSYNINLSQGNYKRYGGFFERDLFVTRIVKGKINIFTGSGRVNGGNQTYTKIDYYIQKGDSGLIRGLRTFTLKEMISDCKICVKNLTEAEDIYDDLSKPRKVWSAENHYIGQEPKLVNALVEVILDYNSRK